MQTSNNYSKLYFSSFQLFQWKPLNVITLGHREPDNTNQMIIITGCLSLLIYCYLPSTSEHNKRLGFRCILKFCLRKKLKCKQTNTQLLFALFLHQITLNVVTLGRIQTDNINLMITISKKTRYVRLKRAIWNK